MLFAAVRASARAAVVAAAVALLVPSRSDAQCTDGSAPPCRQANAARPMPIDPGRVAVIPFRVTTADSLFGEGFAELLALEFTGEGGPRSIDMSTTIAVWRRAGGGLRTPLTQDAAMRLARQLGAGVLCQGSIVGTAGRVTISASLVDATSGQTIGVAARAAGSPDSVEAILGQIATGLLGAGARARAAESGRLTKSPAAMRSYFEGLALRRRGNRIAAGLAFEASFAADTMFASAAFQRLLVSLVISGSAEWGRRTVALRDRLTPGERVMADGFFGANPGMTRTRKETNDDLLRAARHVDSPDAWGLFADDLYHNGQSFVDPDSVIPISRRAWERAMALDSQPSGLGHLLTIALRTRDTVLARRLSRMVYEWEGEDRWSRAWTVASTLHDTAQLARLRQDGSARVTSQVSGIALHDAMDTPIPTAQIAEGFRRVNSVTTATERERNARVQWLFHRGRGQPVAAERAAAGQAPHWSAQIGGGMSAAFSGDLWDDDAFMRAFGVMPVEPDARERQRQCVAARLTAQRGHADSLDISALRAGPRCERILAIWKMFATNALTDAALHELDSIVTAATNATFSAFEHRLLARVYEVRGDTARAVRAIRHYPRDFTGAWLAPTLREEGRYYLMARDTANAVRSFRHYLDLRAEAEPPYVPERDSIRALVATLTRRR